jgi:bifunctional non-homologous end joining protein LigD
MLARLERDLPSGPGYVYEPKWDGFRCLVFRCGEDVDMRSRNNRPLARYFPELVGAFRSLPEPRLVLDGELLVVRDGQYDFGALLARLHPAASRVDRLAGETPATYVAFDILAVDGRDLRGDPFAHRRAILEGVGRDLPSSVVITPATPHADVARRWLDGAPGLDGVVAKRTDLPYQPGTRALVKVKLERSADCVVAGFRVFPDGAVASLLLGVYGDGALHHVGVVSQLAEEQRQTLYECLRPLITSLVGHPWQHGFGLEGSSLGRLKGAAGRWTPGLPLDWIPVRPQVVCEVAYDHLDRLRFRNPARLRRWRPDRDARSCGVEQFGGVAAERRPTRPYEIGGHLDLAGRSVQVSSLDRVLWPDAGVTKAQLLDYYIAVAPVLLPHLADRPLTLHRYPEGVYGDHFFQSRCPPHPSWVRTVTMSYPRTGKAFEAAVVDDLPGLVWAANLDTVEFHPFLGRTATLERPTAVVFDLDPGPPAGLIEAGRIALRLRELLGQWSLQAVVKTSGSKGLHVFVPMGLRHTYDDTKAFARGVARRLAMDDPDRVVDRVGLGERSGKVLVDWGQNDPGRSTVAPYSLRGMRLPTVSMPVAWEEIAEAVRGRDENVLSFTPADVPRRVDRHGDLFSAVQTLEQSLPP